MSDIQDAVEVCRAVMRNNKLPHLAALLPGEIEKDFTAALERFFTVQTLLRLRPTGLAPVLKAWDRVQTLATERERLSR